MFLESDSFVWANLVFALSGIGFVEKGEYKIRPYGKPHKYWIIPKLSTHKP